MKIAAYVLLSLSLVVGCIVGYACMPEGKVVEYRPCYSTGGRYGGNGYRIEVVIENGMDNYIPCEALSIQQITIMCDSLNKRIKK